MATEPGTERTDELVKQLGEQVSRLVRQELQLARLEVVQKGKRAGIGAGMLGGAGLVALYAVAALLAAIAAALALAVPAWAATLIVGVLLLGVAAGLAVRGRKQVGQAAPPVPERAADSVKADIREIKERAR